MSMRIDNQTNGTSVTSTQSSAVQSLAHQGRPAPSTAADPDGDGDQVSLSSAGSLVGVAKNLVSPGRADRIAALTAQVQSGSYSVDNVLTSRALIQGHFGA
ncbi:MAG: flagellar biosynthesis anti-sigma factor FlgM [Acidobacteriaceae bacterium]|nr:flagellar biosynthesis anti-sigma factor FlgM [Acidobacteriaceae bacterium]MBV9443938.1 flagellar biosynthesis anti-sigma factor FlgM [Acidobacteriaceae bacterium]